MKRNKNNTYAEWFASLSAEKRAIRDTAMWALQEELTRTIERICTEHGYDSGDFQLYEKFSIKSALSREVRTLLAEAYESHKAKIHELDVSLGFTCLPDHTV